MMANVGASIEWFVSKFFQKAKKRFHDFYGRYHIAHMAFKCDNHAEILTPTGKFSEHEPDFWKTHPKRGF